MRLSMSSATRAASRRRPSRSSSSSRPASTSCGWPRRTASTPSARWATWRPRPSASRSARASSTSTPAPRRSWRMTVRRPRLRERRARHLRPRRVGPAGDRGLPRRALRQADAAHQGVHRGLPQGVAARGRSIYDGQTVHDPAARRAGHRARQAAEAHQPPGARPTSRSGGRRSWARASRPRPRWPTAGCRIMFIPERAEPRVGRRPRRPAWPSARPTWRRSRSAPAASSPSARTWWATRPTGSATWRGRDRALRRRHGRPGQELLQRPRPPLRLRGRGRRDPGPLPRRQEGRGGGQGARRAGWRRRNLVGPPSYVAERVAAFKEAGVTVLAVNPVGRRRGAARSRRSATSSTTPELVGLRSHCLASPLTRT